VDLLGRFSNRNVVDRVGRLHKRLADASLFQTAPPAGPSATPGVQRLRRKPGEVEAAIVDVLRGTGRPMRMCELHEVLRHSLDEAVKRSTVKMALTRGAAASPPVFRRVDRGVYALTQA
jgi:hypothetical protein